MLKILHINNYDKKGGAETVFNLTRQNLEGVENYSGFVKQDNSAEIPDVKFTSWENNGKLLGTLNYIFSIKNYKELKKFLDTHEIDVIHIHGFFSSLSPAILLAMKRIKRKKYLRVIQTLHDFHVVCPNSSLFNFKKNYLCEKCISKKYKLFIFKDSCDRRGFFFSVIKGIRSFVSNNILKHKEVVDHFISPSEFLKKKLIEDGIDEEKISVIRNPINKIIDTIDVKKEDIICYFGRFSREKNLEFLIKAFSCWKEQTKNDFKLLLIGEGEEEKFLRKVAAQSDYNKDITFRAFLPADQLMVEIQNAKYFALTSKCYENFPMSVAESISLNIIPIVPNIGGMQESVEGFFKIGVTYKIDVIDSWIEVINYLENNYKKEIDKFLRKDAIFRELKINHYKNLLISVYSQ